MVEAWKLEEQARTLKVGGTLHAEVLQTMLDEPEMLWTNHFIQYTWRKERREARSLDSIEGAFRKLRMMGAIHHHGGMGYLVNHYIVTMAKEMKK